MALERTRIEALLRFFYDVSLARGVSLALNLQSDAEIFCYVFVCGRGGGGTGGENRTRCSTSLIIGHLLSWGDVWCAFRVESAVFCRRGLPALYRFAQRGTATGEGGDPLAIL